VTIPAVPEPASFTHRRVPALGRTLHRVGLAASFGMDAAGIRAALERGVQYLYWNPASAAMTRAVRALSPAEREKVVIATGPRIAVLAGSVRRRVERVLRVLKSDYLDVLQLYWLGRMSAWRPALIEEMVKLREEGKVRALGVSIHDRVRAGALARESPLDLLMIRYNAAHPGAERDIFPHLAARHPAVVAYTATAWRRLLRPPRGWQDRVPTAGDCYRFCLTSDAVDIVLMGPSGVAQLDENLAAVARGPLDADEMRWMRGFGAAVHG
jgi:aryl-alcohol dehydrogenase-like predicted oxidoreductase